MRMPKLFAALMSICAAAVFLSSHAAAGADDRVYVDISSPGVKRLPIAIQEFTGHQDGADMSEIVQDDLAWTGLFSFTDRAAHLETSDRPFDAENWKPLGVEIVAKGTLQLSPEGGYTALVSLYDVFAAENIMKKRYSAEKGLLRLMSHKIAGDIYERITGGKGIFSSRIAYLTSEGGGTALYVSDWDGRRPNRLLKKNDLMTAPHWSPDGRRLAYSAVKQGKWGVYILNLDDMKEEVVLSTGKTDISGDFTPDGKYLLISSSKKGTPDIYLMHIATKVLTRLTYSDYIEISSTVSPDGKNIAFVSNRTGPPQVYIMGISDAEPRRLTYSGNYNTSPRWSPVGDRIAFSGIIDGRHQVFLIKPDGGALRQLTRTGNSEQPSFSPDGRCVVFESDREGAKGVYMIRADGEDVMRISPPGVKAFGPSWSP
jgi:TolB protein